MLPLCCLLIGIFFSPLCRAETASVSESKENHPWSITFFNGMYTDRSFGKAVFNLPGDLEKNYLHGLSISRHLAHFWRDYFALELEGMVALHHGRHKEGSQDYWEYLLAVLLRYDRFPWKDQLHTAIALGEGLSLASKVPLREIQFRGDSRRLLNYLAFELELTLPSYPRYSMAYRIHHRSGVFGLFDNVRGASDFYLLGLRYRF